jgi:predicted PurR-regulated permease PerM
LTVGKGAASLLATLGITFVLIVLFLLEGPKMRQGLLELMRPERAAYDTRVAGEISQSATGYALGNLLTSLIAGWSSSSRLPSSGFRSRCYGHYGWPWSISCPWSAVPWPVSPTVLFALGHSLTAGIVTATAS